jgi:hypothetical protein
MKKVEVKVGISTFAKADNSSGMDPRLDLKSECCVSSRSKSIFSTCKGVKAWFILFDTKINSFYPTNIGFYVNVNLFLMFENYRINFFGSTNLSPFKFFYFIILHPTRIKI